jgi:protocatechuate 3,4-dioxygenase, alpha subunit
MVQKLDYLKETPSQTAGPYVHIGLAPRAAGFDIFHNVIGSVIAGPDTPGARIRIEGRVLDGLGSTVKDVLIETWQADAAVGMRTAPATSGAGAASCPTSRPAIFGFDTIKPGRVPGHGGTVQAPHISFWLVARGINIGLQTRMYFPDEDNSTDPVLNRVEHADRRPTLIAASEAPGTLPLRHPPSGRRRNRLPRHLNGAFDDRQALHHLRRDHRLAAPEGKQSGGADHRYRTGRIGSGILRGGRLDRPLPRAQRRPDADLRSRAVRPSCRRA